MVRLRLQSAMEYLMTYGWAILIIAVVLGALFGLGFFNSANLAPKVAAGSCQVYRPNGPWSISYINTEGTCNNELPQYVAMFNGASGFVNILPFYSSTNQYFTISAWIKTSQTASQEYIFEGGNSDPILYENSGKFAWSSGTSATLYVDGVSVATNTKTISDGNWHHVVLIAFESSGTSTNSGWDSQIGTYCGTPTGTSCSTYWFNGLISNVQVYNTSLSANDITALYDEGIGGVPLNINNLIAWWPLNGNANDYSGNLNNGVPTNIIYTSSWTSGYSAP